MLYFFQDILVKTIKRIYNIICSEFKKIFFRGVAQFGRALGSGLRGRRFESCHPDFALERIVCVPF